MFIKAVMSLATTDKDFRKTLKKRMYLYYIMILLGAVTLTLSTIFSTGDHAYLSDFLSGVYTGTGSALIAIGIVFIIKTKKILKDEGKIKQKRLAVFWTLWVIITVYMVIFISLLVYFNKKL